jgi:hypothetical protein
VVNSRRYVCAVLINSGLFAIGTGGMGEVYRTRDTKLGRDVHDAQLHVIRQIEFYSSVNRACAHGCARRPYCKRPISPIDFHSF